MLRTAHIFGAALLAASLLAPASAQDVQIFGGQGERACSTRILWADGPLASLFVHYGQPKWQAKYEEMVGKVKDQSVRLGKDYWTTLHTSNDLTFGGAKVPAGIYYLGLHVDAEGVISLITMPAAKADKAGWNPMSTDDWKWEIAIPLTHTKTDAVVEKLSIDFAPVEGGAPTDFTFTIRWGGHVATAPIQIQLPKTREASATKPAKTEKTNTEAAK